MYLSFEVVAEYMSFKLLNPNTYHHFLFAIRTLHPVSSRGQIRELRKKIRTAQSWV